MIVNGKGFENTVTTKKREAFNDAKKKAIALA